MSIRVTCFCGLVHALMPGQQVVHAGQVESTRVRVPVEGVLGEKHGHRWQTSERWVAVARITVHPVREGTEDVWRWGCPCGIPLAHREPAWETVICTYNAPPGEVCRVAAIRRRPPSDLYVNPRHGAACPCCGQQGTHWVRVDRDPATLPLCMR